MSALGFFKSLTLGIDRFSAPLHSDGMQSLKCLFFLDLVFICCSDGPMWLSCVHYCATEAIPPECVHVSTRVVVSVFSVCVSVCGRQAVSSGGGPVCQCGGGRGEQGQASINQARLQRQRDLRLPSTAQPPLLYVCDAHSANTTCFGRHRAGPPVWSTVGTFRL